MGVCGGGGGKEAQCINGGHMSRHNLVTELPATPPVALPVEAPFHSQHDSMIFRPSKSKVISSTLLHLQIFL